ncbi:MAG: hypothetical protein WEH44_07145 [Pirellulaceae bacterium]
MNHMDRSAIVMMAIVWLVILANTGYCFFRLIMSKRNLGGGE